MKILIIFIMFGYYSNAQLNYFIEYNFSKKIAPEIFYISDIIIYNSFSFSVKKNKILFSIAVGREDWNLSYFNTSGFKPSSFYTFHTITFTTSSLIERQFLIPETNLSIRVGLGGKLYFKNHLVSSFTYYEENNDIDQMKPSVLSQLENINSHNIIDGKMFLSLSEYSYITNIPYGIITNVGIQYSLNKLAVKLYYEPYFMRLIYRNAAYQYKTGKTFLFFSNIGIGFNYQLNFKKKREKEK